MNKEILKMARELESGLCKKQDIDCFSLLNGGCVTVYQEQKIDGELKSAVRVAINIVSKTLKFGDAFNGWTLCKVSFDSFKVTEYGIDFYNKGELVSTIRYCLLSEEY